jgi:hypothetical protein
MGRLFDLKANWSCMNTGFWVSLIRPNKGGAMNSIHFRIFCAVSAILLAAAACVFPKTSQPQPTSTQPAPVAQASSTAKPVQATSTLAPSETALPAGTATETPLPVGVIPTETPTLTPETIFAEVMKDTNCRSGPSGAYDLVTTFQAGAKLEVAARDLGGGFIVVKNPGKPEEECYILANNVRITGDTSILPQYTPLASPTASPSFTATFKKFDDCKGDVFALFDVVNTGSVPFRSAYIKVTNLRTGESAEQAVSAFDLKVACTIAKNVAPLNPGGSGWLASNIFKHDPRGNKLRAIIQACTEKNLKGTCVTTTIPFQ